MQISVKSDFKDLQKSLTRLEKKQLPFAASKALNRLAFELRAETQKGLKRDVDRPTPYTIRGPRYTKSNKRNLEAKLFITDTQWKYLERIVNGSTGQKRPVPVRGNARLNSYGSMGRNYVQSLINKNNTFIGDSRKGPVLYQTAGRGDNQRVKAMVGFESNVRHGKSWDYFGRVNRFIRRNFQSIHRQRDTQRTKTRGIAVK